MVPRKTKTHFSMVEDRKIAENRDAVAPRKSVELVHHWAFLDEIEAPMWVDLDLEAASGYKDNDDDWFQISHQFHQCASRQLISAFSHIGKGNANMDFEIQETSSPKLPPSVSRSRGKNYRIRDWGQSNCCGVTSNKRHPIKNLSSKSSRVNLVSGQKIKPKPSNENRKGNARSKVNPICKSNLTKTAGLSYPKPSSNGGDSETSSCLEVENKSVSTITSESSEQQQKLLDVSSQTVSRTSGLLSALKVTLRKSCVITRQALRGEEIVGGRQSEGHKSFSGKSSVGSSSHLGYDVKNTTLPASQNKAPHATHGKVKRLNMSKESTTKTRDFTSKSRCGSKVIPAAGKSAHPETAKSKVNLVVHSKATRLHRVNEKDSVTNATKANDKMGVGKYNRLADGKENVMSRRSNIRARGMIQVQKVTRQMASSESDRTGFNVPKGKISGRSEGKSLTNVIQKVYFR